MEYNIEDSKNWWVGPKNEVRNDYGKILWNLLIQTDKHMLHNWPDIVLINYKKQNGFIIDIAVPRDENIHDIKLKKIENMTIEN